MGKSLRHLIWKPGSQSVDVMKHTDKIQVKLGDTVSVNDSPLPPVVAPAAAADAPDSGVRAHIPVTALNGLVVPAGIFNLDASDAQGERQLLALISIPVQEADALREDNGGSSEELKNRQLTELVKQSREQGVPEHYRIEPVDADGVSSQWLFTDDSPDDTVVLYVHGGGYAAQSFEATRAYAALPLQAVGYRTLHVGYRGIPEHPFPCGLDDVLTAYHWLLAIGYDPSRIILYGEMAGAGMALAAALLLRDKKEPLPGAVVALSPFADLTILGNPLQIRNGRLQPLTLDQLSAAFYAGAEDPRQPYVSPVFADYDNFPPLLVQAGTEERYCDDAIAVAERAERAGAQVSFRLFEGMGHSFHICGSRLQESAEALAEIACFIHKHIRSQP